MYADTNARGGVLEPEGIVEIKFRAADLIAAMHRLDPVIAEIKRKPGAFSEAAVKKREAELLPVYKQASHSQQYRKHGYRSIPYEEQLCTYLGSGTCPEIRRQC